MHHITIAGPGGYDRLHHRSVADLRAGPGQVRVAVRAIGVNFADCMVRQGLYASAKVYVGWPITPGFEVAGTIDELGEGVQGWAMGDRVVALVRFGGYATQVLCAPQYLMRPPPGWSDAEAAGFPAVFLTAWYGLHHLAHARRGEAVLIHSAAGGVGQALVQLALAAGCRVFGVVGGAHKLAAVQGFGCTAVVDKFATAWKPAARAFAPEGFAVALDANGVETLADSYGLLGPGGRLVVYGFHTMFRRGGSGRRNWPLLAWNWLRTPRFNPLALTTDNKSVLAFNLSFLFEQTAVLAEALGFLLPLCETGQVRPLPVTTFALAEAARAHQALESGATTGKLVLVA
ncbi:MAG: zinc-binding dehydrogenase [Deltaproteobacteria bacterium]|nr:zinc-binding dehydrogenase [Deltaproteobacteria bacterium]